MNIVTSQERISTLSGLLAIIFWGTTIAFSRSLTEQLGPLTAASYIYLLSGFWGCIFLFGKSGGLKKIFQLPVLYLSVCGFLFIFYTVCLYLAIGLSISREQVIEVSIINYLWPGLTLVLSLPLLGKKGAITLIPGIMLGFGGFYLVTIQSGMFSWSVFQGNFQTHNFPYLLAFCAAVSWGLYSNLSRRWAGHAKGNAIPLFLLMTGVMLTFLRLIFPEASHWSMQVVIELFYMSIFPTYLAYSFWDKAMRKGNIILVVSFSYFTPLLSIVISSFYLQVMIKANLWIACALVILGAIICKLSIFDKPPMRSIPNQD